MNLIQCANLGGMEQASLRLMRALAARGHQVRVISLNPIAGLGPLLEQAGIPAAGLDYSGAGKLATLAGLRRALSAEPADALIMTGHNFAASLALAGISPRRRLLAVHYHHEGVMPAWRWRLIYRAARALFQTISFPSDFARREAEAIYPPVGPIAETIRNPIEPLAPPAPGAREAFRRQIGVPLDAPLVGGAGWLIARKRWDVFLRTAAELAGRRPEAMFVIAGDGEERAALERLASALGIAGRVRWTGWLADLAPFYTAIDALLFTSDWDAFGMTPLEAMTHRVPVVASVARGGLAEILDDSCGWMISNHDPRALAAALEHALGDEGRARAEIAFAKVVREHDPVEIARLVEDRLLGNRHVDR